MKRFFTLLLAGLMFASLLAGCKPKTTTPDQTSASSGETTAPDGEPEQPARTWKDLPQDKYDTVFNILGKGGTGTWDTVDIALSLEDVGDSAINSAVYSRTTAVETRHGISIFLNSYNGNYDVMLNTMDLAGTNDYALYDIPLAQWGNSVVKGYFKNLYEQTELRFEESWWDQRFVRDLSLYGQLYGILSDATYVDKMATWAVIFNKDMITSLGVQDNPYTLVNNGKWTASKMMEMGREVNRDTNEDGIMELGGSDIYALAGETTNVEFFFQGCGMPIAAYENDEIVLNIGNHKERANDIFQVIYDLVADSTFSYNADNQEKKWKGGREFFEAQQALFFVGGLNNLPQYFKSFSHDYGVLPMPKWTEQQEEYYNGVTVWNCPVFCIPRNTEDASMSAIVMQAMACRGENSLVAVFYDTVLKGNSARDPESCEMLDLIFNNRCFDLGSIYQFGGLVGSDTNSHILQLVLEHKRDQLTSTIGQFEGTAKEQIEDLVAFYDKNFKH